MYAVLCNDNGNNLLGSDSLLRVDSRKTLSNRLQAVREHRERFRKHFPHKYSRWTHCYFIACLETMPKQPVPSTLHIL